MIANIILAILGSVLVAAAQAAPDAAVEADACTQIRTHIKAQVGLLPRPDTALLERIGAHPECRFAATEVYRAAYGDKPMPPNERRERRHKHRDDDDDD